MRLGLLTGGGDCPGLNAVIRAVVHRTVKGHGGSVVGFRHGWRGVLQSEIEDLDLKKVSGILPRGGTILGTSRTNPYKEPGGEARIRQELAGRGVDALIVVGGEDTLGVAAKLHEAGIPLVGVPKTIDNDVNGTDWTFGFDTALSIATEAIDRLHTTAESHERIMVVEVMGRYAGWIAMHAGVAGNAQVILMPEIPYDIDKVVEHIKARYGFGRRYCIVVVAEGAKPKDGDISILGTEIGREVRLGGIADKIGSYLGNRTGFEVRSLVLGHIQRGGSPTHRDRLLALRFGAAAVRMVEQGKFGNIVAYHPPHMVPVPIEDAIRVMKTVPLDSDTVQTARDLGICLGD